MGWRKPVYLSHDGDMILINVEFKVKPENIGIFMEKVQPFTEATRAEDGNLFFNWYHSADREDTFILVEGFKDDAAEAHVNSQHFKDAMELFPTLLVKTPKIINTMIEGKTEWDTMAEFSVDE